MNIKNNFLYKVIKFIFLAIFFIVSFCIKSIYSSLFIVDQEYEKKRKEYEEQDLRDYKNRVGKYSNDKRWYDE